jgi:hypothetical protein
MLGDLASGPVMRCAASIANGFVVNRSKTLRARGDQARDPRAAKYAANTSVVVKTKTDLQLPAYIPNQPVSPL